MINPEFEAAIGVPELDERVRHVENAVLALLGRPPIAPKMPGGRSV